MAINPNLSGFHRTSPVRQLLISLLIVVAVGTVIFTLFLFAGNFIFSGNLSLAGNPAPVTGLSDPGFIRFTLLAQDISFFIIPALIILVFLDPGYQTGILNLKTVRLNDILLVTIMAFCAFPVTGFAGKLNAGMELPDWLSGIEQWMIEKEDYADHLLEVIMTPATFGGMWFNLLLIAFLPAVGEELIFRGVFQKILHNIFRSGHLSVWVTSVLFSAIHFQFYGFFPRLILGLIFGYLFLWGRNIWLPVIAHLINNAVPTIGAYIKGWETINEPAATGDVKHLIGMIVSMAIGITILARFRKRSAEDRELNPDPPQMDQV
jgi:uncharacterized protein